jgi:hypothetical protein
MTCAPKKAFDALIHKNEYHTVLLDECIAEDETTKNFLNSNIVRAVFSTPLPSPCQYILVNQTPEEFKANVRKFLAGREEKTI